MNVIKPYYDQDGITIYCGSSINTLPEISNNSVDSIVTDPPYELGFMGKSWDNSGIAYNVRLWQECLRVLKPGGHLLAFGGTRTYHRMTCAIEDAGFEIRDMIEWMYSTGFPKSLNIQKALQKQCTCGNMGEYEIYGSEPQTEHNLRPMPETDISQEINAGEEQGEILQQGVSEQGLPQPRQTTENVRCGQSSMEGRGDHQENTRKLSGDNLSEMSEGISTNGESRRIHNATPISNGSITGEVIGTSGSSTSLRPQSTKQPDREPCAFCQQHGTQEVRRYYEQASGLGSALKPAHEPICLARKPLVGTLVNNFLEYGTGGINIDECRIGTGGDYTVHNAGVSGSESYQWNKGDKKESSKDYQQTAGRFPANLIHDGSEEVLECFPQTTSGVPGIKHGGNNGSAYGAESRPAGTQMGGFGDSGSAARFFYCAKASKAERDMGCERLPEIDCGMMEDDNYPIKTGSGNLRETKRSNFHPTVKPLALMEYLVKLVTPPKGTVLDPFMGSGTTGMACKKLGFEFVGIELSDEYSMIASKRINAVKRLAQSVMRLEV